MTTLARPVTEPSASATVPPAVVRVALLRWSWRLVRRRILFLWLGLAGYVAMEVLSFRAAYPDEASRRHLVQLSASSAVRMFQGVPGDIERGGAFAVWDGGWMISLIVACWALLTVTRLTRGEEDSGRAELVLCRPAGARQVLAAHLTSLTVALAGTALAVAATFVVVGEPVAGAALFGSGVAAFGAVMVALGGLCAQLVEPRRHAMALGAGFAAAAFLVRIVGNSADSRNWALSTTPFGWLDRLAAFSTDRWVWLTPPLVSATLLAAAAVVLSGGRDTGAALWQARSTGHERPRLLGGPVAFGWRLTSGALLAWTVAMAVIGVVFGMMIGAIVDFIHKDDTYRRLLESMGVDMSVPVIGFLSYLAVFFALPFAAFVGWRLGAVRQEEADGRLDNLLVRGVVRWRWLAATTLHAFGAAVVLVVTAGAALWLGGRLVDAGVTASGVAEPLAGTLPLIALFTGLAVLTFGVIPRLTVVVPVGLAVLSYLLDTFGAMLDWPAPVLALSPFHHLARLPGSPLTLTSAAAMTAVGVLAAVAGIAAFSRRDVTGA